MYFFLPVPFYIISGSVDTQKAEGTDWDSGANQKMNMKKSLPYVSTIVKRGAKRGAEPLGIFPPNQGPLV